MVAAVLAVAAGAGAGAQSDNAIARLGASEIELARPLAFRAGSADLVPESDVVLRAIAGIFARTPALAIEVRCWTDPRGASEWNLRLSQARADAIASGIAAHGVSPARVRARGMGEAGGSATPGCTLARTDRTP